jgi:hypothetical protein
MIVNFIGRPFDTGGNLKERVRLARNRWSVKYSVDAVGSAVHYRTG